MNRDDVSRLIAEFIGTFALIFIGAGSIIVDRASNGGLGVTGIAFAHGLAIATMVSAAGHISGGHFNPAVTCAFLATRRLTVTRGVGYIVAQLLGAVVAAFILKAVTPAAAANAVGLGTPVLNGQLGVGIAQGVVIEAVLTFFLVFAVFGTAVDERAPRTIAGFGIGMVIAMDILAGGPLTGAAMNPARTFGPALAQGLFDNHLVYWIGPILGGVVAALLYDGVLGHREERGVPKLR